MDFDIGCGDVPCNAHCTPTADINCTHANCTHTPQLPFATLDHEFVKLYMSWFDRLKAVYPKLLWMNNMATSQTPFIPVSNGRMYEGGAGINVVYKGGQAISKFVAEIRMWTTKALQPNYINVSPISRSDIPL